MYLSAGGQVHLPATRMGRFGGKIATRGATAFMPHIIAEPCVGTKDTSCVEVCPVDCIHPTKNEADFGKTDQLYIDPDTCIDCGLCVDECPVKAIFPQEDLPGEWNKFIQVNLAYYKK